MALLSTKNILKNPQKAIKVINQSGALGVRSGLQYRKRVCRLFKPPPEPISPSGCTHGRPGRWSARSPHRPWSLRQGSRRGRATSPGRPSAPPSLSGRPCPLVGPIPGYLAPAWAAPRAAHIVAPGPARTPSLTSARALHQPPQRCRRLAIHAVPSARRVPASPPPLPLPQGPDAQPGPRVLDSGAGFWRWLTLFLPSTSRKMTLRQRRRSKARPPGLRC